LSTVEQNKAFVLYATFADGRFGDDLHSQGPAACFLHISGLHALACLGCGAALDLRAMDNALPDGSVFADRYRIDHLIGEGPRKQTYLAWDSKARRHVALAVILPGADPLATQREVDMLGRVCPHPNIVTLYDAVLDADPPYLVFEYIPGGELRDYIRSLQSQGQQVPLRDFFRTARQLCRALAQVHGKGLIHRDVSATHIWLDERGEAHLGDFDRAMALHDPLPDPGGPPAAEGYPAPELLTEARDARADLYSLGGVLYELLTGREPTLAGDGVQVAPPSRWRSDVPPGLDELILSMLATDRDDRPPSAQAVLEELRSIEKTVPDGAHSDLEDRQDEFLQSAKKAAESGSPRQMSVRELIGIWGARGRDFGVNERVHADLGNQGMTTEPDFRAVTLENAVAIVLATQGATDEAPASPAEDASVLEATPPQINVAVSHGEGAWDHGLTIGNLPSASKEVCSVTPEATFEEAITLMLTEDFSQLAVMTNPRDLKGAVTWKSIAKARHANPGAKLSAAIIKAEAVLYTADLISMLPVIEHQEFIFVSGRDRSITGIVTLADVVEAYGQMASPFFMIGRIDQRLRHIIEDRIALSAITPLIDPEGLRDISSYNRLTMGDYQRILENPECWDKLGWPLHRKIFCTRLDKIAKIRNNIMHFNNDPLPDDVLSMLQNFINLLQDYGNQQ
jgi:serine/threonine protein kinase/CBS domain-containing protein